MAADICRLCLRPIDKAKSIDLVAETTKFAMLKEFLPEMNLDITENTQVCRNCMQELEVSYNFKQSVVVNEANIQTKLEENKLKKIDLKLMLDDVAKKELKEDDYVCRTCLLICRTPSIHLFDTPSNMMPCSFVKKMCQLVFELEFIASDKPVLCDECWETLQTVYNFRKCCLKTDKKLRTYVAKKNLKKLGVEEFKKFVEENPPIDNDEVSSDDELDGYIKEEPIDEEELKFDPEEASCSSASLKFKEETTVKSESDEDMEDEPELLDPKALKSETSELDGEDCKMEIGDVKVDAEGEGAAGPSGRSMHAASVGEKEKIKAITNGKECLYPTSPILWLQGNLLEQVTSQIIPQYPTQEVRRATPGQLLLFKCSECLFETTRKRYLTIHSKKHTVRDKPFNCAHCPYKAISKPRLKQHMIVHADAEFSCNLCTFQTKHKYHLANHKKKHLAPDDTKTLLCPHCSYRTDTKAHLASHMLKHAAADSVSMLQCTECPYQTKWKSAFSTHQRIHAPPGTIQMYQCTECSYQTVRKHNITAHRFVHAELDADKKFPCEECSYQAMSKFKLERHKLSHAPPNSVPMYNCDICTFQAKRKDLVTQHKKIHSKGNPDEMLRCANCSYQTISKPNLKNHMLVHTNTNLMYQCSECSFETKWKTSLTSHKKIHAAPGTTPVYQCTECPYTSVRKHNLTKHKSVHATPISV